MWPRTCAWLLRLAVETALDGWWDAHLTPMCVRSPGAQFLVLPQTAGDELARRAEMLWTVLSRAGHHHAFELAPTAGELQGWQVEAAEVARALGA